MQQSNEQSDGRYTMEQAVLSAGASPEHAAPFREVIMPYTPRPDQIEAFRKQVQLRTFGLLSEARTGKTVSFSMACIYFAHWGFKSIVLMPPVLFLQFKEFWGSVEGNPASLGTLDQPKAKRDALLGSWLDDPGKAPDVLLMTKEVFKIALADLIRIGYKNLVYDEAHMGLQNESSKTYGAVKTFLSKSPKHRLTLSTGTPIPNEVYGAYPLISLVNPGAYAGRGHFNREHVNFCIQVFGRRQIRTVAGYHDLEKLHRNLYLNSHRVTKAEVLNLKVPNIQVVPIQLAAAHRSLYRRLMTQRILEHEGSMINAIQFQALRQTALQLITSPQDYGSVPTNAVLDAVEEILEDVGAEQREKVVIFANYNRSVETLAERLSLKKYKPAVVYGPGGNNAKEAERFKKDRECRVLVANPIAGGVGLTLGGVSSTAIFAEPVSTPGQFDQACSRIMLAGQTEPVVVYLFKVLGTISPRAIDLMLRKGGEVKDVTRDKQTLLDELLGE